MVNFYDIASRFFFGAGGVEATLFIGRQMGNIPTNDIIMKHYISELLLSAFKKICFYSRKNSTKKCRDFSVKR